MVQPIQYQVPVADPFAGLLQGLKLGATVQDLQQAQAANELRRQQALQIQQKMEQQRQAQAELQRIEAIPEAQRTPQDRQAYIRMIDPNTAEQLRKAAESQSEEQRRNGARIIGRVASALHLKRPDIAANELNTLAEAEQDPQLKRLYGSYAEAAVKAPDALMSSLGYYAAGLGKEYGEAFNAATKQARPSGQIFASSADKIRAGIVDEKGNALPGTWSVDEKGAPKRISEKAEPSFETYTAAQLTAKYGLKGVEPGLYKRRSDTGEISKIGGGGTTINMKTEGPPPKDYRYVRDDQGNVERMEVIPGSKTAKDLETAATAAQARTQTEIGRANIIVNSLDTLENLVKTQTTLDPVTGRTGALMGQAGAFKAGSKRADAEQAIDTVIANIGFAELNRMRRESPNGAALGNVTERELAFLQRVVGSLDLIQSDPQLLKNISVIREVQNKIINEGLSDADIARYSAMLGLKAKEAAPASRRAEGVVTPAAPAATPFPVAPQPTVKRKSLEEIFSGTPAAR